MKPVADEIIEVPAIEMIAESAGMVDAVYARNEAGTKAPRKRRARFYEELPRGARLYEGHDGFLVRTALIRSDNYRQKGAPILSGPEKIAGLVQHLMDADQEHMVVLSVNGRNELLAIFETAVGGSSSVDVEIKHILKTPLLVSASGAAIVHNHPGGISQFSAADLATTVKIAEALECIGVKFLDHIVVAADGWTSYLNTYGEPTARGRR